MASADCRLSGTRALVIDSNPTSRSVLVAQLSEFGLKTIVQISRVRDAMSRLEFAEFEFVLCEHNFRDDTYSGQALLDDLRRAQLLPFSTVFIMVTGEASYEKVAEAAESALDGYLLKPYSSGTLYERLSQARHRKVHLRPIFEAIEAGDFEAAAQICMQRFKDRELYWLYAARIGAELLLRVGRHSEAQALFEAVIAAKTLPWARLGVARARLESGQTGKAVATLEGMISDDPAHADAYDVLGRAHFDSGNFTAALETYRVACELTPGSVARLQKHGMMAFYTGDRETATKALHRAVVLGLESKMFDLQSLVLLAFTYLQDGDGKSLTRCHDQMQRALERQHDNPRVHRLARVVHTLEMLQRRQVGQALEAIRQQARDIRTPEFDFEAGCNLVALLSALASTSIDLDEAQSWIQTIGLRFCSTRGANELLSHSATAHPPYRDDLQGAHAQITKQAEQAMSISLGGDPRGAILALIGHGTTTLNGKLMDLASLALQRHEARIPDAAALHGQIEALRTRFGLTTARASIGQDNLRPPGSISLRVSAPKPPVPAAAAPGPAVAEPLATAS